MREDVAAVDEMVAALHPDFEADAGPGVHTRDVILVTGPWLAGSTSLTEALRQRLPECTFIESADLADDEAPSAVVFVTSAVTPLAASDFLLLDTAAANTDLVIGAVNKIDVHKNWRDVLAEDAAAAAAHDPRYANMRWVGVAAAPELGEQQLDELADAIESGMADDKLGRRNRLRAWQTHLQHAVRRHDDAAAGAGRQARIDALRQQRSDALRQRRVAKSERTIALRNRLSQAKVQLTYFARNRCASVRGELADDAASMTRGRLPAFEAYVHRRVHEVVGEVDSGITKDVADVAIEFGLTPPAGDLPTSPSVPPPQLANGGVEARLTMVFGAIFGLGVVLTVSRLLTSLAPAYTAAGLIGCAAVGLAVAVWVVSMRRTLRDRAVLDRWVADVITGLRAVVEQMVATRLLDAESMLTSERAELGDAEAEEAASQVAAIDDELRQHGVAAAQATAQRDRELPGLQRALEAVCAELDATPN
jgi:hypothetical protein